MRDIGSGRTYAHKECAHYDYAQSAEDISADKHKQKIFGITALKRLIYLFAYVILNIEFATIV